MGILFKQQEDLEQAAAPSRKTPAPAPTAIRTPPPLPAEARVDTRPDARATDMRMEPRMVLTPNPMTANAAIATPPPPPTARMVQFSVEDFLKLVHELPVKDNATLVVRVVEATLASVNIHITDIMPEISRRESVLQDRIEATQKRAEDLEVELVERRAELSDLESELAETTHLRNLLHMTKAMGHPGVAKDPSAEATLVLSSTGPGSLIA